MRKGGGGGPTCGFWWLRVAHFGWGSPLWDYCGFLWLTLVSPHTHVATYHPAMPLNYNALSWDLKYPPCNLPPNCVTPPLPRGGGGSRGDGSQMGEEGIAPPNCNTSKLQLCMHNTGTVNHIEP